MMRKAILMPLSILLVVSGCTQDRGCTDPTADNYEADAVKDDGTCIPPRNKMVGDYTYTKVYVDVRDTTETEIIGTGEISISESNTGPNDFVLVLHDMIFGPPVVIHGNVEGADYTLTETTLNQNVPFSFIYEEFDPDIYVDTLFLWDRKFSATGVWLDGDSVDSWLTLSTSWYDVDTPYVPSLIDIPQDINYYLTKVND